MVTTEDEPIKRNHVTGPKGWTQYFDDEAVDLMLKLGLIKWVKTTSSNGWEVKFYEKRKD